MADQIYGTGLRPLLQAGIEAESGDTVPSIVRFSDLVVYGEEAG